MKSGAARKEVKLSEHQAISKHPPEKREKKGKANFGDNKKTKTARQRGKKKKKVQKRNVDEHR